MRARSITCKICVQQTFANHRYRLVEQAAGGTRTTEYAGRENSTSDGRARQDHDHEHLRLRARMHGGQGQRLRQSARVSSKPTLFNSVQRKNNHFLPCVPAYLNVPCALAIRSLSSTHASPREKKILRPCRSIKPFAVTLSPNPVSR